MAKRSDRHHRAAPQQRYASPRLVAECEGVSPKTVLRWCVDGRVVCRRNGGGRFRIAIDDDGFALPSPVPESEEELEAE